jgi:hypothetical protein
MDVLEQATVAQLKKLCFNTGIAGTGNKSVLVSLIRNEMGPSSSAKTTTTTISSSPFKRIPNDGRNFHILSIDMGIRNFSVSRIKLDKTLPFNKPPVVKEWIKFDLNAWGKLNNDDGFDPISYAPICDRLVSEVLFNDQEGVPDVVLIERQRARSMGSRNVIEWVFRVNMLESMLHGFLYSKIRRSIGVTDIISTSAKRMGNYWKIADEGDEKKKTNDAKKFRIKIVENWLRDSILSGSNQSIFKLDPERFPIREEILHKLSKVRSKSKWINQIVLGQSKFIDDIYEDGDVDKSTAVQKGDDLVDSLLHSIAWYEWERNKMILSLELRDSLESALDLSDKLYESHIKRLKRIE